MFNHLSLSFTYRCKIFNYINDDLYAVLCFINLLFSLDIKMGRTLDCFHTRAKVHNSNYAARCKYTGFEWMIIQIVPFEWSFEWWYFWILCTQIYITLHNLNCAIQMTVWTVIVWYMYVSFRMSLVKHALGTVTLYLTYMCYWVLALIKKFDPRFIVLFPPSGVILTPLIPLCTHHWSLESNAKIVYRLTPLATENL